MPSPSTAARQHTAHAAPGQPHHMARIFRAFHLVDALADSTIDALKVLRGARAFLLGYVLETLTWEEGLLDPGSQDHRRVLYRHALLRWEISAYGREVWQVQAAGGLPGRSPDLETKLRARIERIQALLDQYATLEVQGV